MSLIRPSSMWRDVSPTGAVQDLITVFKQAGPNRWRFAFLALIPPIGMLYVFGQEGGRALPPKPDITYITTYRPDRTEAEIAKSNIEHQKIKDRLAVEQAKREEEVREMYKAVGRATGIDVDAIEATAKAERAAEKAAEARVGR